jgi:hypothetical protein
MTNDSYIMGKTSMANLTKIVKDSEFLTNIKDKPVQTAVLHGCESWMLKKADTGKIDAFNLWMWKRFFGIASPARTNASVINQRKPKHSGETLATVSILKYFGCIKCT